MAIQIYRLAGQRDDQEFLALRYKELCVYAVENSSNKHELLDYYSGYFEDKGGNFCFTAKYTGLLNEALCNVLNTFKDDLFDEKALHIHDYSAN